MVYVLISTLVDCFSPFSVWSDCEYETGDCENCIKACPVGALTPYKVDDTRCLVGVHLLGKEISKYDEELTLYEASLTKNSHLMCIECQKACKYGREKH